MGLTKMSNEFKKGKKKASFRRNAMITHQITKKFPWLITRTSNKNYTKKHQHSAGGEEENTEGSGRGGVAWLRKVKKICEEVEKKEKNVSTIMKVRQTSLPLPRWRGCVPKRGGLIQRCTRDDSRDASTRHLPSKPVNGGDNGFLSKGEEKKNENVFNNQIKNFVSKEWLMMGGVGWKRQRLSGCGWVQSALTYLTCGKILHFSFKNKIKIGSFPLWGFYSKFSGIQVQF